MGIKNVNHAGRIVAVALASRLLVLTLMIVSDAVFPDLSSSAHLQNFPCDNALDDDRPGKSTFLDELAPWDSVYFVRIAKCGYETDAINAFFPLLPYSMRYGKNLLGLSLLERWIPEESQYALVGLIITLGSFIAAALALYSLTLKILKDPKLAAFAVVLFCFNPASVFYSAIYTESLFAACTWMGMLFSARDKFWSSVIAFTAAAASRSNGILACWFLIYRALFTHLHSPRRKGIVLWLKTLIGCLCIAIPYAWMQIRAYGEYCTQAGDDPPWCDARLPSLYGYVQATYWQVGFLRFYEKLVRLPRIVQSFPVGALAFGALWTWCSADWHRTLTLGLWETSIVTPQTLPSWILLFRGCRELAPFMYHFALMTATAFLMMHVHVATRFLSSSPVLFWWAAAWLGQDRQGSRPRLLSRSLFYWTWSLSFILLGCLFFTNFLPWT